MSDHHREKSQGTPKVKLWITHKDVGMTFTVHFSTATLDARKIQAQCYSEPRFLTCQTCFQVWGQNKGFGRAKNWKLCHPQILLKKLMKG